MSRSKKDRSRKRERWLKGYKHALESNRWTKKYAARARRVNALEEYNRTGDERWYPYDN